MKLNTGKNDKKVVGTLRRTQFITTAGCGAIVDLPHDSVIIAGTDYWENFDNENYIIYEESLQSYLGMDYFISPRTEERIPGNSFVKSRDIPAYRFPETLICPKCERIANYRRFGFRARPKCPQCKRDLIPSRFVVACEDGHLDDFPYSWWVHRGGVSQCGNPEDLIIFYDKKSGGLDSIKVMCRTCRKVRSMEGCFSKNALSGFNNNKCTARRPWLGDNDPSGCEQTIMRTLQRGASNLYFGIHASALSIPPWSNKIQDELKKIWRGIEPVAANEDVLNIVLGGYKIHERCKCSLGDVKRQIRLRLDNVQGGRTKTYEDIIEDEYRALTGGEYDDKEFKTVEEEVPEYIGKHISRIVLVKRLREVMALRGFTRINPPSDDENKCFTGVSRGYKRWLPAIELRGEGIFIRLNSEELAKWEALNQNAYMGMEANLKASFMKINNFSPRYVLLHTLSHMLIRQLVLQCGYSSSALKERIYSTITDRENAVDMAGILIYTATSDSEGSLGGLVREGATGNILNTFKNMLEEASWCSSDPLCIESHGQGMNSLNYAACHSCALLPETSCEARNCLLDRGALIGKLERKELGYFSNLY